MDVVHLVGLQHHVGKAGDVQAEQVSAQRGSQHTEYDDRPDGQVKETLQEDHQRECRWQRQRRAVHDHRADEYKQISPPHT